MQEPPSAGFQPQFAQPPYATPPPTRRGAGPMMYCLGCMGIAAVIAVAIVVFGYFSMKKAMSPVTDANVRSLLPPGVPLYPGLSGVLEKQSRSIQLPSKAGSHRMVVLSFNTTEGMGVIGPWYQSRLTPKGWTGGVSAKDATTYQFKKGDTALTLNERSVGGGKNVLIISVVEGIPLGSVGTPGTP